MQAPTAKMRIIECSEDFGGPEDGFAFNKTVIVYELEGSVYRAFSRKQYQSTAEIQLGDLYSTNKIHRSIVYPRFEESFTKAEGSPEHLSTLYLKEPSLSSYDPRYPQLIRDTWLEEVKICELLKQHPHPNIAQYHGCAVSQSGMMEGMFFSKYEETLMDRVNPKHRSKNNVAYERSWVDRAEADEWLRGIESGLEHLHGLGIVHNDINPNNIMFQGDTPVIIDFDSARHQGHALDLVKRTYGWHDEKVNRALPSNDLDALREIRMWLWGESSEFQF